MGAGAHNGAVNSPVRAQGRPLHQRPRALLAVGAGGTVGTAARAILDEVLGADLPLPASTLTVNLTGAFALGLLLAWLAGRGPDAGVRRDARLLLGTGVLGGYTTYSSFAVQGARLLEVGALAEAAAYVGVSLVGGVLAALAGVALGDALTHPARPPSPGTDAAGSGDGAWIDPGEPGR